MSRRIPVIALLGLLAFTAACTNKKVQNPLANVASKQPDKVLFDRAMDALRHNRFDVSRMTLQTLINTYPDSEYVARAKLAVADSWYAEGGAAAMTQAEREYKDFITFFPNMPEAGEAQFKIANIHYQEMEKPDRDYTHAMRAEDEYRQMIMQFPDSKLVPEAKQRLLEVQEVLAEREYRIGRFYYLRPSYPAAIARLRSAIDKYPLYSKADDVLYLLGQAYEGEIGIVRASKMRETEKARMLEDFTNKAAEAYSRIITRYPLMSRTEDAKSRLQALHQPVPKPTRQAVAQNRKEEQSREEIGMWSHVMGGFKKRPDVAQASKIGDPTLVDPTPVSATDVVQQATRAASGATGDSKVAGEIVGGGTPGQGEATPRSDAPPAPVTTADPATTGPATTNAPDSGSPAGQTPAAGELKPNVPDSNELKPNVAADGAQPLPAPQQVNELENSAAQTQAATATNASSGQPAQIDKSQNEPADDADYSSSKKKKKKGLRKIVPF